MTKENKNSTLGLVLILGSMAAIGPLSIDMYLPAFNDIAAALHTDRTQVGYTLTSYFLGIGVGQILFGPLSDRYGRKWPTIIGLIVFARSEEHTSELQSRGHVVCRLLLEKKNASPQ